MKGLMQQSCPTAKWSVEREHRVLQLTFYALPGVVTFWLDCESADQLANALYEEAQLLAS